MENNLLLVISTLSVMWGMILLAEILDEKENDNDK